MAYLSRGAMSEVVSRRTVIAGGPAAISGHIVRDLLWTECGTGSIWLRVFSFSQSLSFCQYTQPLFYVLLPQSPLSIYITS